MILVVQKLPSFSITRILTGIVAIIRIDTKKTYHCAERKAYAYGTWTLVFFDNV